MTSKAVNFSAAKLDNGNVGLNVGIGNSSGRNYELTPKEAEEIRDQLNDALEQEAPQ